MQIIVCIIWWRVFGFRLLSGNYIHKLVKGCFVSSGRYVVVFGVFPFTVSVLHFCRITAASSVWQLYDSFSFSKTKNWKLRCRLWLIVSWRGVLRVQICWWKQAVWLFLDLPGPDLTSFGVSFWATWHVGWHLTASHNAARTQTHRHAHTHTYRLYRERYALCWWGDVSRRKSKPQLPE